jgi:nuclear-control-of-ATPase protein 2
MPSPFVDQLLKPLDLSRSPSPVPIPRPTHQHDVLQTTSEITVNQTLRSLLISLNRPLSAPLVNDTVGSLIQLERSRSAATSPAADTEENDLKQAILSRLVVGLYSEGLDICISQAMDAETEADWWADVGRSRRNVAWYLVQSASTTVPC